MMQLVKQIILGVAVNKTERQEKVRVEQDNKTVRDLSEDLIQQLKKKNNNELK